MHEKVKGYLEPSYLFWKNNGDHKKSDCSYRHVFALFTLKWVTDNNEFFLCYIHAQEGYRLLLKLSFVFGKGNGGHSKTCLSKVMDVCFVWFSSFLANLWGAKKVQFCESKIVDPLHFFVLKVYCILRGYKTTCSRRVTSSAGASSLILWCFKCRPPHMILHPCALSTTPVMWQVRPYYIC